MAAILATPAVALSSVHATNDEDVDLQVNIAEALTITISNPTSWAKGGLNNTGASGNPESGFLRNKVSVSATTNNPLGLRVSMYTRGDTDLRNTISYDSNDSSSYIPTLSSPVTSLGAAGANFPVNQWGYSIDDTGALNTDAHYYALRTSSDPITLIDATYNPAGSTAYTALSGSRDVYFGAKADSTKQAGTYARTVYFAAVTGTIDTNNPSAPVNPSTPDPINNYAHYNSTIGSTTHTNRSTTGSGTDPVTGSMENTTTQVTNGDVTTTYAQAYGVTSSTTSSALATAFAVAAGVSAISGTAFFVAAKRKKK